MGVGGARYLFGDSESLHLSFNVLDTLQGLVECVREVGTAYYEIQAGRRRLRDKERQGEEISTDLDRFLTEARVGLMASGKMSVWPEVHKHAESVVSMVESSVRSWKEQHRAQLAAQEKHVDREARMYEKKMRAAIDRFVVRCPFDVDDWTFESTLVGERLCSTLAWTLLQDISISYDLDAVPGWAAPFKVGDMLRPFSLEVGFKKKLLRKEPVPHRVDLSDHYVVGAKLTPKTAKITLARKITDPSDRVDLELRLTERGVDGVIHDVGGGFAARTTADHDLPHVQRFWSALRDRFGEPGAGRCVVRSIEVVGRPLQGAEDMFGLVECFVEYFRPIVADLSLHSANETELSLKVELGQGRREELYVERAALSQHLLVLPRPMLERLAFPQLLPVGTLSDEASLIELTNIVDTDAGESAVTVLPTQGAVERVLMDDSSAIDLTELALSSDEHFDAAQDFLPGWARRGER